MLLGLLDKKLAVCGLAIIDSKPSKARDTLLHATE